MDASVQLWRGDLPESREIDGRKEGMRFDSCHPVRAGS